MLTEYIKSAMTTAEIQMLDNGYYGKIPGFQGVYALENTKEKCREILQEVLEEWLILKLIDNDPLPVTEVDLNKFYKMERV